MPNVRCGIDNTLDRHDESTLRLCGKSSIHLDTTLSLRVETILPYVKLGKTVACKLHYLKYHTRTHDCLIDSDGNLNMSGESWLMGGTFYRLCSVFSTKR